ncbi:MULTISPECIES: hypothetical protein [Streptomyces]|uniref:Uncharacterized protein n=1 Tax=Streptomyces tsukubensis (strain DSM 42081 / NBRC 108919 / NRRL 18488 / 9993) TaxID=1114943 RepID=I2N7V0_STRT9|nr:MULTISPECIES: hypothetical protein [Streptomyces]AZK97063.1 hypothetical protein B7R87_26725 [Streptomyces tsukubensis]EIF93097.1 hypothetical protein [Streptomyces tsukubensis NRRL18488]MYS66494.1 hypothetical protein [Streptomyces sp. SID5473]QKM66966.1 hypothetical protein STSU_007055 [Streptomyces tsukubensis NRRL18488]TAI41557.1 hypothetical protein EWI31_27395 [Streptomyces tsukubensis]
MNGRPTARSLGERIESLYGRPLAELKDHADHHRSGGSMLAALLAGLTDLQLAERGITFHRDRLLHLARPDRTIGTFDAGHLLDNARRIGEAVAVRDAHARTLTAVLDSLRPAPAAEAPAAVPAPPALPVPAGSAHAARTL